MDQLDSDHVKLTDGAPSIIEPFVSFSASCPVVPDWEAEAPYPGTVFRFPLHVPETALASAISKISISKEDCINTTVLMQSSLLMLILLILFCKPQLNLCCSLATQRVSLLM